MLNKQTLTPKEVGKLLGIGNNKAYELMKREDFPSFKIGNNWFVAYANFNTWLQLQGLNKTSSMEV